MTRAEAEAALKACERDLAAAEACRTQCVPPMNRSKRVVVRELRAMRDNLSRMLAQMPAPKKKPAPAGDK